VSTNLDALAAGGSTLLSAVLQGYTWWLFTSSAWTRAGVDFQVAILHGVNAPKRIPQIFDCIGGESNTGKHFSPSSSFL